MRRVISFEFGLCGVDPAAYNGWHGWLANPVNDARDSLNWAVQNLGAEGRAVLSGWNVGRPQAQQPPEITLDATRKAWRDCHVACQTVAQPGDLFLFGYSGHGGRVDLVPWGESETLCFCDGQLTDREQYDLVKAWPAGCRVVYWLDSCHSGGMDRDMARFGSRSLPDHLNPDRGAGKLKQGPLDRKPSEVAAAVLEFCACKASQTAGDGPGSNGTFTGSRLSVWPSLKRGASWGDWFEETRRYMARNFPEQTPVLNALGPDLSLETIPVL